MQPCRAIAGAESRSSVGKGQSRGHSQHSGSFSTDFARPWAGGQEDGGD